MRWPGRARSRARRRIDAFLKPRGYALVRLPEVRLARLLSRLGVDLLVDVGANVGEYVRLARRWGYRAPAISFEPLDGPFTRLEQAARADPAWDAYRLGLGAAASSVTVNVANNRGRSSSVLPMLRRHLDNAPGSRYVGAEIVELVRLDEFIGDRIRAARAPFLKVDVQGFELAVLEGAGDRLADFVGLQIELSFVELYDGGTLVDGMIAWLRERGFEPFALEPVFAGANGQVLQADGLFLRSPGATAGRPSA